MSDAVAARWALGFAAAADSLAAAAAVGVSAGFVGHWELRAVAWLQLVLVYFVVELASVPRLLRETSSFLKEQFALAGWPAGPGSAWPADPIC